MRIWGHLAAVIFGTIGIGVGVLASPKEAPQITFLEPTTPQISEKAQSVPIAFRAVSPDGTRLIHYEVFIDGVRAHPQPFPIEPSLSEADIKVTWEWVHRYPDGAYRITVRVTDAKGRQGEGVLLLTKGAPSAGPRVQFLSPTPGQVLRGKVPILVRAEDQEGIATLTVKAVEKQSAQVHPLLMKIFGVPEKVVEVRVVWETDATDQMTRKPLVPDGVYLLQARALTPSKREGVSGDLLVYVSNGVAQPPITPGPIAGAPPRGGLTPGPQQGAVTSAQQVAAQERPTPVLTEASGRVMEPSLVSPQEPTPPIPKPLQPVVERKPVQGVPESPALVSQPAVSPQEPISSQVRPVRPVSGRPRLLASLSEAASVGEPLRVVDEAAAALPRPRPIGQPHRRPVLEPLGEQAQIEKIISQPEPPKIPSLGRPRLVPVTPPKVRARERTQLRTPPAVPIVRPEHSFNYTVIAGDTLYSLAERFGVTVRDLARTNGLSEDQPLLIGQRLTVPARPVHILVDGQKAEGEVPSFIKDGRTVGSLRALTDASGLTLGWDHARKEAWTFVGKLELRVGIGKRSLLVGDSLRTLSLSPFLLRNRTFVPVRDIAGAIGKTVSWEKGTVRLQSSDKQ